jgi:hypothetical protein
MARVAGAVVAGYVVMFAVVFAGLSVAYLALGPERAFRPGVFDVSGLWVAVSFAVGFGAALAGGWLARGIGRTPRAPWALAAVVVVLGLALAIPALGAGVEVAPRPEGVGVLEAMQQARTPAWILLANPLLGAIGVLLGGGVLRPAEPAAAPGVAA